MGLFGSKPKEVPQKKSVEFTRSTDKSTDQLPDLDQLLKGQGLPMQFSQATPSQPPSFQPPKNDFEALKQKMMQQPPQPSSPPQPLPFLQPQQPQFMQQPFQPPRPAPPQFVQPVEEAPEEEQEIQELVEEEPQEDRPQVRDKLKSPQSLIRLPGLEDQRTENPVFVRIDKYKDAIKEVRDIRKRISELQASFEKILTIQDKETDLIENLTEAFISLKSLSQHVDKNLFEPQE